MILKFEPCGNSKSWYIMLRLKFNKFLDINGSCSTAFFRLGHIFHFQQKIGYFDILAKIGKNDIQNGKFGLV